LASRPGSTSGGQKLKATRGDSDMRGTTPDGTDMLYRARRGATSFMEGSNDGSSGFSNNGVRNQDGPEHMGSVKSRTRCHSDLNHMLEGSSSRLDCVLPPMTVWRHRWSCNPVHLHGGLLVCVTLEDLNLDSLGQDHWSSRPHVQSQLALSWPSSMRIETD